MTGVLLYSLARWTLMGLWEISLRTQYDYPFIRMSGRYPDVPISMWCIWGRELLQVATSDPEVVASIEGDIRSFGRVVDRWVEGENTRIFMLRCTCDDTDSPWYIWDAHEMVEEPPAIYRDGWGYFRVVGFDETHTRGLFKDMQSRGPTELIRKRELPLTVLPSSIWVNSLFSDLTGKQIEAVVKAHQHGYYRSPRQTKTENIAGGLGVSRSTFEEHLRKAENRIVASLVPYLELYEYGERPQEGS